MPETPRRFWKRITLSQRVISDSCPSTAALSRTDSAVAQTDD